MCRQSTGKATAMLLLLCALCTLLPGCDGEDEDDRLSRALLPTAERPDTSVPSVAEDGGSPGEVPPATDPLSPPDAVSGAAPTTEATPIGDTDSTSGEDVYSIDGIIGPDEYAHRMTVAGVEVHWVNDAETLRMGLDAPAEGYVAVGFDPADRKVGANYIIGYVKDGEAVVRDHVGTRGNLHEWDVDVGGEDNLLAFAGTESEGSTVLEFIIPLDSGDPRDRPLAPGRSYELQVAYQNRRDDLTSWHSRHGTGTLTLDPVP